MEKKTIVGIFAIALIALIGFSLVSANAGNFGFGKKDLTEEDKTAMNEQKDAIRNAIESKDFIAWKSLMEARIAEMQNKITEENFNTLIEKHAKMTEFKTAMEEAKASGNFTAMKELRNEYGIGPGKGKGKAVAKGFMHKA